MALRRTLWIERPTWGAIPNRFRSMTPAAFTRQFFIHGITLQGRTFRPGDWAERLADAMACFRPEVSHGSSAPPIGHSPYCVPRRIDGVNCVVIDGRLRDIEPIAWDFVMNFARDNQLRTSQACLLPDTRPVASSTPPA